MARIHGTKDMWLEELRTDGEAFRAVVAEADPAADVPSCPGWTISDLVSHLGGQYGWVRNHLVRGMTTMPDVPRSDAAGGPAPDDALTWWCEQFDSLVDTLDVLDPEMPAWNWAPQAKRAAFWHRRMAHETSVHRWDAQMAIGRAEPIAASLAADGVAEVLDTWLPAGRRAIEADATGLVALGATDVEYEWNVRLRGGGVALLDTETIFDDDEHRPGAVASGSASDLLLALWGRVGFDVLDISGDEALLNALRVG
jgi:uncharacterized protein (TIGR03083 family)